MTQPVSPNASPRLLSRTIAWLPFVATAALVSLLIHWSMDRPWLALLGGALSLLFLLPNWLLRRRLRRIFLSADVPEVLQTVEDLLDRTRDGKATATLMRATTLLAYGRLDEAERLARYVPRDRRSNDDEQWLVFQILNHSFGGERERALTQATSLMDLPLPLSPWTRHHSRLLREGVAALARAFARCPKPGDVRRLRQAGDDEPLLAWALRYAEVIVHVEEGNHQRARAVLDRAPAWPKESAFGDFHAELSTRARPGASSSVEQRAPNQI